MFEDRSTLSAIRSVGPFVTAAGILLASLLVWAGFWNPAEPNGAFAVMWLYVAAALDLISVGWMAYSALARNSTRVPLLSIGLLTVAFEMLFLQVCQSFLANAMATAARAFHKEYAPGAVTPLFLLLAALFTTFILAFTIMGVRQLARRRVGNSSLWPWVANSAVVYMFYFMVARLMWNELAHCPELSDYTPALYAVPLLLLIASWDTALHPEVKAAI